MRIYNEKLNNSYIGRIK